MKFPLEKETVRRIKTQELKVSLQRADLVEGLLLGCIKNSQASIKKQIVQPIRMQKMLPETSSMTEMSDTHEKRLKLISHSENAN